MDDIQSFFKTIQHDEKTHIFYFSKVFWENTAFLGDGKEEILKQFLVLNFVVYDLPT